MKQSLSDDYAAWLRGWNSACNAILANLPRNMKAKVEAIIEKLESVPASERGAPKEESRG